MTMRTTFALLTGALLCVAACGGVDRPADPGDTRDRPITTPTGDPPPPPTTPPHRFPAPADFDGVLARYSMPGGECDRCDFVTTFRADGTVQLRSSRGDRDGTFDAAALGALVEAFDPSTFAGDETNCGREVDGNAPIVAVPVAEIDLCFWVADPTDPLYGFVRAGHARLEAERDAAATPTSPD